MTDHFRISNSPVDVPLGIFGTGTGAVETTYDFGLIEAGGADDGVGGRGDIDVNGVFNTAPIHIEANTNIVDTPDVGLGSMSVSTDGNVTLTEVNDDLRVKRIQSSAGDVSLTASNGSIINAPFNRDDVLGDAFPDADGNNITLQAFNGSIGTKDNVFDIESSLSAPGGVLTATATNDIFITEATDNLNINTVASTRGTVRLVTVSGGIFDANNNAATNVSGVSIDLETNTTTPSGIGTSSNPLEINSSNSGIGRLYAVTGDGIFITENAGELNVLRAESFLGDVALTVPDSAATGNDLNVIETGMDFSAAMTTHSGTISSPGSVTLTVGDDVSIPLGTSVGAEVSVTINMDPSAGDPDAIGGTMTIRGDVSASNSVVYNGGGDDDVFDIIPSVIAIDVNGNLPTLPTMPGDVLRVEPLGNAATNTSTVPGNGVVAVTGFPNINYTSIEMVDRIGINDGPINFLPSGMHMTGTNTVLIFSESNGTKLKVADIDEQVAPNFMVTLSTLNGKLGLVSSVGLTVTGEGSSASPLIITGALDDINLAFEAGLAYAPSLNFFGTDTLTLTSNDNGNTGTGTALTDTDMFDIVVKDTLPPTANLANPVNGASLDEDTLNAQRFIDVTFSDIGFGLNAATVTDAGAEFTLGGAAASGVTVNGTPTDQGGGTYRYTFTGDFTDGNVTVNFIAGSFADLAPNPNLSDAETESFTVTETPEMIPPTADLANPTNGSDIFVGDINSQGYLDVTFTDLGGSGFDMTTVTGDEISLSGDGVGSAVLDGTVLFLSGTTFRYGFTGSMEEFNSVSVTFVAGTFADLAGNVNAQEVESFFVTSTEGVPPTFDLTDPAQADFIDPTVLNTRRYIDVTFFSNSGAGFDTSTILDAAAEFTVSGSGTGTGVTVDGIPTDLGDNTYRYSFTGDFVEGLVFMTFEDDTIRALDNFMNDEETEFFTVIVDNQLPTADLADPFNGATVDVSELNTRGYIDVTFDDQGTGIDIPNSLDLRTINGDEIAISGPGVGTAVLAAPSSSGGRVNETTYRYFFTGQFTTDTVNVTFVAGTFQDLNGNDNAVEVESFTPQAPVPDTTAPTVTLADPTDGGTIDASLLNSRGYIDVTFSDAGGIDPASINDAAPEIALSGTAANVAILDGAGSLVSGTTYRYTFNGFFVDGTVSVDFIADSFADLAGNTNAADSETFTVQKSVTDFTRPTANLAVPTNGSGIALATLNDRGYIDVTFIDNGSGLHRTTVTDAGAEINLTGTAASGVTLDGAARLVFGTTSTYRYSFTGAFAAGGVGVQFVADSFADRAGNLNATETESFVAILESTPPTANLADAANGETIEAAILNSRGYIDVAFSDFGGSGLKASTLTDLGSEIALTGTAAAGVTLGGGAILVTPNIYRYAFTGSFVDGVVGVEFVAGTFEDFAGNGNVVELESFTVGVVVEAIRPTADLTDPTNGGTIKPFDLNGRGYIDVTFTDIGEGLDVSTIDGDEVSMSGTGVGTAVFAGTAVLQSGTTYRYAFTGGVVDGAVMVEFVADSFADLAGNLNVVEIESFTVDVMDFIPPTADLADPTNGVTIDSSVLNSRGYIDVVFTDTGGSALDPASITDADAEFTLTGAAALGVTVDGAGTLVSGTTYRYAFTGTFIAGAVGVTFTADSFEDLAGNTNVCDAEIFMVQTAASDVAAPTTDLADPTNGGAIQAADLNGRGYLDVTFTDLESGLDVASVTDAGSEFVLSGDGAVDVIVDGAGILVSGTTYRYAFSGDFVKGEVKVEFIAGSFRDVAGNLNVTEAECFTVLGVNEAPVNGIPAGPHTTAQDTALTFSIADGNAFSVADVDAGTATNFIVTLSADNGTLSLVVGTGLIVTGDGSLSTPLVLTGALVDINTALGAGLVYTPDTGFVGTDTLTITSDDQGNSGTGGPLTDTDSISIEVGSVPVIDGDFNNDGNYDCLDINALIAAITAGTNDSGFDLTGDGLLGLADRDAWLAEAGGVNLGPGKVYRLGDANLDGFVDASDFNLWNANKFTTTAAWCSGDFNADGFVDASDFNLWNVNKFTTSDAVGGTSGTTVVIAEAGSELFSVRDQAVVDIRPVDLAIAEVGTVPAPRLAMPSSGLEDMLTVLRFAKRQQHQRESGHRGQVPNEEDAVSDAVFAVWKSN